MKIKTRILSLLALFIAGTGVGASQSLWPALQTEILGNNPTYLALTGKAQAAKQDAMTGLTLPDPEVNLSYMWGTPSDVPGKTNIEVSQTLDFATLSGAKKRVAQAQGSLEDASLRASRSQLAREVEEALVEYVYCKLLVDELERQYAQTDTLLKACETALHKGAITTLDYNSVELAALSPATDLSLAKADLAAATLRLTTLNGGKPLSNLPTEWPMPGLPANANEWIEQAMAADPTILSMGAELELAAREVELRRKQGLPEVSVGYLGELVRGDNHHGMGVSVSVPIWANSGRVKAAKASQAAALTQMVSAQDQFRLQTEASLARAAALLQIYDSYKQAWTNASTRTRAFMKNALEKGVINTVQYHSALTDLYEYALRSLQAGRDYQLARVALYAPTL